MPAHVATYAPDNHFSFTCPVFDATTRISSCIKLRELTAGGKFVGPRQGCQACMKSSLCPVVSVLNQIARDKSNGPYPDTYASKVPVHGRLRADILAPMVPIRIQERHLMNVPEAERDLIRSAYIRIEQQASTAPAGTSKSVRYSTTSSAPKRRSTKAPAAPVAPAINRAAATGDLAAAIN